MFCDYHSWNLIFVVLIDAAKLTRANTLLAFSKILCNRHLLWCFSYSYSKFGWLTLLILRNRWSSFKLWSPLSLVEPFSCFLVLHLCAMPSSLLERSGRSDSTFITSIINQDGFVSMCVRVTRIIVSNKIVNMIHMWILRNY